MVEFYFTILSNTITTEVIEPGVHKVFLFSELA
jgi:hypothetical protein